MNVDGRIKMKIKFTTNKRKIKKTRIEINKHVHT